MVHFYEEHIFKIADRCYRKGVGGKGAGLISSGYSCFKLEAKTPLKGAQLWFHFTEEHSLKGHKCG